MCHHLDWKIDLLWQINTIKSKGSSVSMVFLKKNQGSHTIFLI